MPTRERLLARLEEIGRSLAESRRGLALLALGSCGRERDRLDEFSDLDFFAIVVPGAKGALLEDLGWLSRIRPIAFSYRNTPDGHKVLFDDGVFCEFAVFEPAELATIPFAPGRAIWQAEGFDAAVLAPRRPLPSVEGSSPDWLLGEILSGLYVGLCRFRRGERLAAMRLVQGTPVDLALRLLAPADALPASVRDPFAPERHFELRFPALAREIPEFMQGYHRTPESALALLAFLERAYPVNAAMAAAIRALASAAGARVTHRST